MLRTLAAAVLLLALAAPTRAQPADPPAPQGGDTPRAYMPLLLGPPAVPSSLRVTTATYLGAAGADSVAAAAIAPDGSVLLGGAFPGYAPPGATELSLLGGGDGALVRLAPDGRAVRSVTRLGATVTDAEINDAGQLAVCGAFGVALLSADAAALAWSAAPGAVDRCAVGSDGTVAALVGNTAFAYGASGALLKSWAVAGSDAYDLAVDGAHQLVIVAGYTQVNSTLQLPYLRGYGYDGAVRWRSYDIADAPGLGADTRAERVALGADGMLYMAGSINGGTGASVFSRDPKDVSARLGGDRLIVIDSYTDPYNIGSVKMSWLGRFDPEDGALLRGQSLLTRLSSGKGNSIGIRAIAADAAGRVYITGDTACCIKDRGTASVAGVALGAYESGEGYVLGLSADLTSRGVWTAFAAPGGSAGGSPMSAVAVRDGVLVVGGTLNPKAGVVRGLVTSQALQGVPASAAGEGYLVVAPAP